MNFQPEQGVMSISELVRLSSEHLRKLWPKQIWVGGELSNVRRYPSGHVYLTLKDSAAEISGVMFARQAALDNNLPTEGNAVAVLCQPSIYAPRGRFQIVISEMRLHGQGQLYEEFIRTKAELREQGWFDSAHKRALPKIPRRIGVVVSLQGAAWRDVHTTLRKRFPAAAVSVFPAPAQGDDAPAKITAAISQAANHGCDVLLVCRGGGSFEDLHAYNTKQVAAAIWQANVPIITGIGHETDETIADFVADQRAATPTAAAVAAVPERAELLQQIEYARQRLLKATFEQISLAGARIDDHSASLHGAARQLALLARLRLRHLHGRYAAACASVLTTKLHRLQLAHARLATRLRLLQNSSHRFHKLAADLQHGWRRLLKSRHNQLDYLAQRLRSLNPSHTLQRGYAIITAPDGTVVSSVALLPPGADTIVEMHDGAASAVIGDPTPSTLKLLHDK